MKQLTVGKLKRSLEGVPDDLIVVLSSDSGLDQCPWEGQDVVLEDAWRVHYKLPDGQVFQDTGENEVDEFHIYGNYREIGE